jgi:hypothetical protein
MNPYLAKLRCLTREDAQLSEPSKPSKPSFEGFEGDRSSRVSAGQPVEFEQGYHRNVLAALRSKCPELVEPERWQQAIHDANSFLATWGAQAHTLGWTARELFGLHAVPERPAATYRRLSRYDETGLIWLLQGRAVVALTETEAAILGHSGAIQEYRKHNKPALGPLGDSLDDMGG